MVALFGFTGTPRPEWLLRMQQLLAHRGRGGEGTHWVESCVTPQVTMGLLGAWTSAERQKSGAGVTRAGDDVCAIAGCLRRPGPPARGPSTHGPSAHGPQGGHAAQGWLGEVLLQSPEHLAEVRGEYVAAVARDNRLRLIRDGAGVRTIYFAHWDQRLVFASEPKAIWGLPGFPRRLRASALAQYLAFSFVPGQSTMLQDVDELPAGHVLEWTAAASRPTLRRYFHFEDHGRGIFWTS